MARDVQKEIHDLVTSNRVVLFMKGTPQFPQCGFSSCFTPGCLCAPIPTFQSECPVYVDPSRGLVSIELDYKESKRTDQYGNQFRYRAKVKDARGEHMGHWAWDVFLLRVR